MIPAKETKSSTAAYLTEPLEFHFARLKGGTRVAHISGSKTHRNYGTVHALLGRRLTVSANACTVLRNPEKLPDLMRAMNALFNAKPGEVANAVNNLMLAAAEAGALEE